MTPSRRLVFTTQALSATSHGSVAETPAQKESRSDTDVSGPAVVRPYQARNAHTPPPDVPLRATTSNRSSRSRRFSTPAVKAVWLPPPWQAIATRGRASGPGMGSPLVDVGAGRLGQ